MNATDFGKLVEASAQVVRHHCRAGHLGAAAARDADGQWVIDPPGALKAWRSNIDRTRAPAFVIQREAARERRGPTVDPELVAAVNAETTAHLVELLEKCRLAPGLDDSDQLDLDEVFETALREWR